MDAVEDELGDRGGRVVLRQPMLVEEFMGAIKKPANQSCPRAAVCGPEHACLDAALQDCFEHGGPAALAGGSRIGSA